VSYRVLIKNSAKADLAKLKRSHLDTRFKMIVETLKENPCKATDSFEKLQPPGQGFYSRRLNAQHRVVYKIIESEKRVEIYSAWSHYRSPLQESQSLSVV